MTIREDILAVLRATGKPVQSKEIARALGVSTASVASHLGRMAKEGIVVKRTVAVGEPVHRGPFVFPESNTRVWFIPRTMKREVFRQIQHDARRSKKLPRAVLPRDPVPHSDDMIQMLDDMHAELWRAFAIPFNQLRNDQ